MNLKEIKAREMIAYQTTERLVEQYELMKGRRTIEASMVRSWLTDELESRDQEACDAWIDSDDYSPRRFFLG